jgi:hypothetical protein
MIEVLRRPIESTEYVSIRYSERLAEVGIGPSVGSTGDSYGRVVGPILADIGACAAKDPWYLANRTVMVIVQSLNHGECKEKRTNR